MYPSTQQLYDVMYFTDKVFDFYDLAFKPLVATLVAAAPNDTCLRFAFQTTSDPILSGPDQTSSDANKMVI